MKRTLFLWVNMLLMSFAAHAAWGASASGTSLSIDDIWIQTLTNGDAETPWSDPKTKYDDLDNNYKICAWSKQKGTNKNESGGSDPFPAEIVTLPEGGHAFVVRGAVADSEGEESNWDNQFWIQSPRSWEAGTQVLIKFRYKASVECSTVTQYHNQTPSDYKHWVAIGDVNFTTEWQQFEKVVTIPSEAAGIWSIAFNLNAYVKDAVDFYFDDLSWSALEIRPNPAHVFVYAKERDYLVANEDGTPQEAAIGSGQPWDNQFVIMANRALTAGEETVVEFKYKAAQSAMANTQCGGSWPGEYIYWDALGDIDFATEEQTFSGTYTVPTDADGMHSLAFNLAVFKGANIYEIYDIVWKLSDDTESLIDMHDTYNFYVKTGADMSPHVYSPETDKPKVGDDLTFCLVNPMFSDPDGKGWTFDKISVENAYLTGGYPDFTCAEAWSSGNLKFDVYQDVTGMPDGLYSISCNAFVRMGGNQSENTNDNGGAYLYMNDFMSEIGTVFTEGITAEEWNNGKSEDIVCGMPLSSDSQPWTLHGALGKYFPDGMNSASQAFAMGMYETTAYGLVEGGKMRIGFTKTKDNGSGNQWVLWSNFRLYYMDKDPTALDAVLRTYINRAQMMIDTISCANKEIVIRSLKSGIGRATISLGEDSETMYQALIYLNSTIKNYIVELDAFVNRMKVLQTLYSSAVQLSTDKKYAGLDTFQTLLKDVETYSDNDYASQDPERTDAEYIDIVIDRLSQGIEDYEASQYVAFSDELQILEAATSVRQGYTAADSHIIEVDIQRCGLTVFPVDLLKLPYLGRVLASHNNIADITIPDEYRSRLDKVEIELYSQDIPTTVDLSYEKLCNYQDLLKELPKLPYYDYKENTCQDKDLAFTFYLGDYDWEIRVYCNGEQPEFVNYYTSAYRGNSGDVMFVGNPNPPLNTNGSFYRVRYFFEQGDANFINGVDATDLQAVINYSFLNYSSRPFNFTAADTYKDGKINIQDVISTVNILLNEEEPASSAAHSKSLGDIPHTDDISGQEAYVYTHAGKIYLRSAIPVAALSVKADGNIRWNLRDKGLLQTTANGNVVAYSLDGSTLPSGEDILIGSSDNARITSISLSDVDAQPISAGILDSQPTGIGASPEAITGSPEMIYDISGRRNAKVINGVNIIKNNDTIVKIRK